jgi:RsiW-degrading membrane proteinase PrsW (M82 family)
MIYLLERKPYRIFAAWQFIFSALISAFIFATIENLLYIHFYIHPATVVSPEIFAHFRWTVCTGVHMVCSAIASVGMIRVWKKQLTDGKVADMSVAFRYFAIAISVHGVYNLVAIFLNRFFLK